MTEAERVIAQLMSERQLQDNVLDLAERLNLLAYHTFDSRRSEPGFPDLVLVGRRVLFVELKRQRGRLSADQQAWHDALLRTTWRGNPGYYLWRPYDWTSGEIEDVLRSIA